MALAFRDCCNQYSYFLLDNTPSFVSEFETYYIQTLQGINFCAVYINLPTLNYVPPVYNLSEMTQQSSCGTCIEVFPCPSSEVILINEFTSGSVAQGTDCQVITIPPLFVECLSFNPTTYGGEDGRIQLIVSGAVAPYRFSITGTENFLQADSLGNNIYTLYNAVPAGTYRLTVQDNNLDFTISVECVITNPPTQLIIDTIVTPVSIYGGSDGIIEFVLTSGIPPYTITLNGVEVDTIINNLPAGVYIFQVTDGQSTQYVTVEVTQPQPIVYPNNLCMTFELCGTRFNLNFIKTSAYENLKPRYKCTNPTKIGLTQLFIRWGLGGGFVPDAWATTVEEAQIEDIQFEEFPRDCNLSNSTFAIQGSIFNNQQPTGQWSGSFFSFMNGIFPVVTAGGCPPTPSVRQPIPTYCQGPPEVLSEVIFAATGGSGPPYTFFYSSDGVNYTQSGNIVNLRSGTYSLKVSDSDGIMSLPITFIVPTEENIFKGTDVDFCAILEPETKGLGGVLDRPVQAGEYREIDVTISNYFDFSTLPEGTEFTGRFQMNFYETVITGDFGFDNPLDCQSFLVELKEIFYINNNERTDFLSSVTNPFGYFPSPYDIIGSNILYTENYGRYRPGHYTDNCTASTVNPSRTSPNSWYDCDNKYSNASFIEGDTRILTYGNTFGLRGPQITFNPGTKLGLTLRIKMRNNMAQYIPQTLNETDTSTLLPSSHTPAGASLLNLQNVDNFPEGSYMSFFVDYQINDIILTQVPPTPKCFKLEYGLQSLGDKPTQYGASARLYFSINNGFGSAQAYGSRETTIYNNSFVPDNNTCPERPSWAQTGNDNGGDPGGGGGGGGVGTGTNPPAGV
jgi:hypothetical protein